MNAKQDQELQNLYQLNKHQLSDLLFMDEELKFLKSLIDKYFGSMIQDIHINRIQLISTELTQLNMVKSNVVKDVLMHQGNLEAEINGLLNKSIDFLKLESVRIDDEIHDIHKSFKNIKREIFTVYKNRPSKHQENKYNNIV